MNFKHQEDAVLSPYVGKLFVAKVSHISSENFTIEPGDVLTVIDTGLERGRPALLCLSAKGIYYWCRYTHDSLCRDFERHNTIIPIKEP